MADTASDIRIEFDRENGNIGHKFRFVYHFGPIFRPTDYRPVPVNWAAIVTAASGPYTGFSQHMDGAYSPWWDDLPGTDERVSAYNAVREIMGL